MDKKDILLRLKAWELTYNTINSVYENLHSIIGIEPESPLGNAIWSSFDKYTATLSELIGDEFEFLAWYAFENDFGRKKLGAKAGKWKKDKVINNLCVLIDLIEDCK